LDEALTNLLSTEASNIQVDTENIDELIQQIINANKNLTESNKSNDWTMIGKDLTTLQNLIYQLENVENQKQNTQTNNMVNNIINNSANTL